ncbi:MAG TPA: 2-C-methyl-D-erythritol 4-phosphate cytidylyltransferase [Vicinamibacterales bacterium]|nr:2-C-methyl-D-erythritol 4-phosphate cytidylyltransferase [Vicinamibacterales bacterium]
MHVAAIVVAAGRGERMGGQQPKQFLDLGKGRTMVEMSVAAVVDCSTISEVVVALPSGAVDDVTRLGRADCPVHVVTGGARRQDSVANAFARVSRDADVVVVHDAARPFVTAKLIDQTIAAAARHGAAIAALPVRDTVKSTVVTAGGERAIRATLSRDDIFLAQTPQAFRREIFEQALAAAADTVVTDEAMLVERSGIPVHIVMGDPGNIKVTTPEDLAWARGSVRQVTMRIGNGYDLHRLVAGRPLILAGVHIPFELGLDGHSDADIVCHAVTDAILGAAALGDIGRLFPDTDAQWKGADSMKLLRSAMAVVGRAGYRIANVDVTVIAQQPKLLPHIEAMRANLAAALDIEVAMVSVKGKTNEGVDATGLGHAMACHAVALITL